MEFKHLIPVEEQVMILRESLSEQTIGKQLRIHTLQEGFPSLEAVDFALIGVAEGRNAVGNSETGKQLGTVRKYLYQLFPGNWQSTLVDLGNLPEGATVSDTYFALKEIIASLVKKKIIPLIIGGGQDITYANYRAYDTLEQVVNMVAVDRKFDFGERPEEMSSQSYLSRIVLEQPNNLFNFANIGYQTYFSSQEEIDLIDRLFFEAYRLGEITEDISMVEPVMRDADIVSVDMGVLRKSDAPANANASPNGLYGEQLCAIARYAGISDKVSSFGIYEYNAYYDEREQTAHLIAQILWYFIEGYNYRAYEYPFTSKKACKKYFVPTVDNETMCFYKSNKTGRWWMEVPYESGIDNRYLRHLMVPCTYQDYLDATNHEIPERWWRACKRI